jgi:SAM-dependent methyltransferase
VTGYAGEKTHIRPFDTFDDIDTVGLADGAFRGNTQILYFAVCYNDNFTYIGKEAFMDSVLETVDLFDSVTEIGDDAFNGSRLTALTIPASLEKIGERAFANCAQLAEVTILCGDVEITDFGKQFDCIVVYNAFPHFPVPERLIQTLSGLLKPGGTLTVAHGMSREKIDAHHHGTASHVSNGLMPAENLAAIFEMYLNVTTTISNDQMYQVVGAKE